MKFLCSAVPILPGPPVGKHLTLRVRGSPRPGDRRARLPPPARRTTMRRLISVFTTAVAVVAATAGAWVPAANAAGGPNLSLGRAASASTVNGPYAAGNINDGNQGSYWESSGALPQWARVDLGSSVSVDQVVLKLPTGWGARTQTLSIEGSADGTNFTTIVARSEE